MSKGKVNVKNESERMEKFIDDDGAFLVLREHPYTFWIRGDGKCNPEVDSNDPVVCDNKTITEKADKVCKEHYELLREFVKCSLKIAHYKNVVPFPAQPEKSVDKDA